MLVGDQGILLPRQKQRGNLIYLRRHFGGIPVDPKHQRFEGSDVGQEVIDHGGYGEEGIFDDHSRQGGSGIVVFGIEFIVAVVVVFRLGWDFVKFRRANAIVMSHVKCHGASQRSPEYEYSVPIHVRQMIFRTAGASWTVNVPQHRLGVQLQTSLVDLGVVRISVSAIIYQPDIRRSEMTIHLHGVGEAYPDVSGVSVKEQYGGYLLAEFVIVIVIVVVAALAMQQQPGMNLHAVLAGYPVSFEGYAIFGRGAIILGIVGGASRQSTYGGEVEERILVVVEEAGEEGGQPGEEGGGFYEEGRQRGG